ncbi:MAG: hypothetical protein IT431_08410 [Phycisphaerales bacterium]|nr:hypothetical protein [Phycisphaerales bacterium]
MDGERATRLEEAVLFGERRVEELAEQVLALSGRVEALSRRLGAVEMLMGRVLAEDEPPEGEAGVPGGPG